MTGLVSGNPVSSDASEYLDEKERLANLVRKHNFTQQTNALDVDKHMFVTSAEW